MLNFHLACLVIVPGLFRSLLAPLFVGLPPLQGDALFGAPFLLWQDASLPTSPTSDAAAPDINVPPFALSGASPSLHAQHEEQHFLFIFELFKCLHWRHSHNKVWRVADCSKLQCWHFIEGGRVGEWTSRGGFGRQI